VLPENAAGKPASGSTSEIAAGSGLNPHLEGCSRTVEGPGSGAALVSLAELLRTKSSEYELLAEWHGERAPLDEEHVVACQAMAVVGIVLREVAEAIDVESGEEAGA
jgi:hypothetical protein